MNGNLVDHGIAVIDTNVVVAALLTENPESPTASVLDGMLAARFPFAVSLPLLTEYREVLLRPPISRRHGLTPDEIDALLIEITQNARIFEQTERGPRAPEPGDQLLWDLLAAIPLSVLVTGDRRLLESSPGFAEILDARSFRRRLAAPPSESSVRFHEPRLAKKRELDPRTVNHQESSASSRKLGPADEAKCSAQNPGHGRSNTVGS